MATKPLTRTKKTMSTMGPLRREAQAIQNDLVKLARRLDRFQSAIGTAEGDHLVMAAERRRVEALSQPESKAALRLESIRKAREMMLLSNNAKQTGVGVHSRSLADKLHTPFSQPAKGRGYPTP